MIAGKKIFYRTIGSGKKIMLIHGFPETGDVWRNQTDYLKDKFLLIIPDLPGSGRSALAISSLFMAYLHVLVNQPVPLEHRSISRKVRF